ncbi:MAG: hypothetical protein KC418_07315 [Anaerolineales bacterium]|nr:hypothetical protein [Anaerolineales bacterium]MCB8950578.1 hypothetical protein [Ardenticatenales bacterium]
MGFLKRLFGGDDKKEAAQGDTQGIYLYARCDNCGAIVRVRADKQYDLQQADNGYQWHKTIVDSRCFRRMQTVVTFNRQYEVVSAEIGGGQYVTEADYLAWLHPPVPAVADEDEGEPDGEE